MISLIESIIWAEKPRMCVEIGTNIGETATHIGFALARNGRGHLHTFEIAPDMAHRAHLNLTAEGDLPVTIHAKEDLRFDPSEIAPIDFLFVDGSLDNREASLGHWVPHMRENALVAVHDTLKYQQPYEAFLRFSRNRPNINFVTPRGISFFRV